MADTTIDSEAFVLHDLWPDTDSKINEPMDGFLGESATAVYPIGTKCRVYQDGVSAGGAGWSTFIYLKTVAAPTNPVLAKHICALIATPSGDTLYTVTNDADLDIGAGKGPIAVAIQTMTAAYYGWFWCGGVCPEGRVIAMGGSYKSADTDDVAVGDMTWANCTSGTAYGDFGFAVWAVNMSIIGWSAVAGA